MATPQAGMRGARGHTQLRRQHLDALPRRRRGGGRATGVPLAAEPAPPSAAKALASRPGGFAPQNTPAPDSAVRTQAATGRTSRQHRTDSPLSELALAPFSAYQHVQQMQEPRQNRALQPSVGPPVDAIAIAATAPGDTAAAQGSGTGMRATGAAVLHTAGGAAPLEASLQAATAAPEAANNAAAALAPSIAATAEPSEPSFTPNTTTVRLRAAMQWMQLQLRVSPGGISRPRRYSDSSVSPALKILAPSGEAAAEQSALGAAAQESTGAAEPAAAAAPRGGLFDRWETEGPTVAAAPAAASGASASAAGPTAVDHSGAAAPPVRPYAEVQQAGPAAQPDWPQPLIWQSAAIIPAAPLPAGAVGASAVVPQPPAAGPCQSQGPAAESQGRGASFGGPLRDISSSAANLGQLQSQGQEQQQGGAVQGQGAGSAPKEAAQQRRGSGLRFSLRW